MLALFHFCGHQVFGASDSFKGSYEVYLLIPDVTISLKNNVAFSKQSDFFFLLFIDISPYLVYPSLWGDPRLQIRSSLF